MDYWNIGLLLAKLENNEMLAKQQQKVNASEEQFAAPQQTKTESPAEKLIRNMQFQELTPADLKMNCLKSIDRAVYIKEVLNLPKTLPELFFYLKNPENAKIQHELLMKSQLAEDKTQKNTSLSNTLMQLPDTVIKDPVMQQLIQQLIKEENPNPNQNAEAEQNHENTQNGNENNSNKNNSGEQNLNNSGTVAQRNNPAEVNFKNTIQNTANQGKNQTVNQNQTPVDSASEQWVTSQQATVKDTPQQQQTQNQQQIVQQQTQQPQPQQQSVNQQNTVPQQSQNQPQQQPQVQQQPTQLQQPVQQTPVQQTVTPETVAQNTQSQQTAEHEPAVQNKQEPTQQIQQQIQQPMPQVQNQSQTTQLQQPVAQAQPQQTQAQNQQQSVQPQIQQPMPQVQNQPQPTQIKQPVPQAQPQPVQQTPAQQVPQQAVMQETVIQNSQQQTVQQPQNQPQPQIQQPLSQIQNQPQQPQIQPQQSQVQQPQISQAQSQPTQIQQAVPQAQPQPVQQTPVQQPQNQPQPQMQQPLPQIQNQPQQPQIQPQQPQVQSQIPQAQPQPSPVQQPMPQIQPQSMQPQQPMPQPQQIQNHNVQNNNPIIHHQDNPRPIIANLPNGNVNFNPQNPLNQINLLPPNYQQMMQNIPDRPLMPNNDISMPKSIPGETGSATGMAAPISDSTLKDIQQFIMNNMNMNAQQITAVNAANSIENKDAMELFLSGLINIHDVGNLLKTNGKHAASAIVLAMAAASKKGLDTSQLQDTLKFINASVSTAAQETPAQTLKSLMMLYLPWLPLNSGVGFDLEIETSPGDDNKTLSVLIVLIQTLNYGNLKGMFSLTTSNSVNIHITCSDKFPKDELLEKLKAETNVYSMQSYIEFEEQKPLKEEEKENRETKVNLSATDELNPYLLLMAHSFIRNTILLDNLAGQMPEKIG